MDTKIYLFPFEKINKGERIALYGAGCVGQQFFHQLRQTGYGEIVCFFDKSHENYNGRFVPVLPPDKVTDTEYDKIVVAVAQKNAVDNIIATLIEKYHVPEEKIVPGCNRLYQCLPENEPFSTQKGSVVIAGDNIRLCLMANGNIGDLIIVKRFIVELVKHLPYNCKIDLAVPAGMLDNAASLVGDLSYVNCVRDSLVHARDADRYDAIMRVRYFLVMYHLNELRLRKKDSRAADFLINLRDAAAAYKIGEDITCNRIHWERCKFRRLNCYTAYNYTKLLNIFDYHVPIPLVEKYRSSLAKLKLKRYITVNYGWALSDNGAGNPHAKVWPMEHYIEFIKMFREEFPNVDVVQLGLPNTVKIPGVQKYLFGESLELIKYVLQSAVLHIDCEGGLVHLATQLGTKCAVLFGPTPIYYFGYDANINIQAGNCHDCIMLDEDFSVCYRRMNKPECMWSITPDLVMNRIRDFLRQAVDKL